MMLYIHLPFCKRKCKYCAFCSGQYSAEIRSLYMERVISMMDHFVRDNAVETVYIGGGTPSALPLPLWKKLLTAVGDIVNVPALQEFTVECNPESTSEELLSLLKANGVNRLSFGVQSLCEDELAAIGRLHSAEQALSALRLAKRLGFHNISADLIYGLPGQTKESFEYSLKTLLSEEITHLSVYNLQLEEGTPLYEERNTLTFADEDEQMEMYDLLCDLTRKAGFIHYEISNFCKDGFAAVHNSGYWTGKDYLGIGAAAHSKLSGVRCSFDEDVIAFAEKKDFSFDERIPLTEQDILEERIMLGLRTQLGATMKLLDRQRVERFVELGLGAVQNDNFILNDAGFMLSNSIIADLI